jgi:LAGLIDADG-like domain
MPSMTPADFMATAPRALDGNSAWASRYAHELKGVITRQATLAPRSRQVHLGPSELGIACDRAVVGKLAGLPRTNHVSDPWPSIVGTAVHAWLAQAFLDDNARERMLRWVTETRVIPHPEHPGTADLYDAYEAAVVDHKGIYIGTPVATPGGWTPAGMLQAGDTVFGSDGKTCIVTRVYPAQYRDCYRIVFDDGSSLVTDDVQELPFVISGNRPRPVTMNVAEAASQVWSRSSRPQRQLRLYNGSALELPDQELAVHPYVLGCWLGDGGVHGGAIGKPDEELFRHIQSCGYEVSPAHGTRQLMRTVYGLSTQLRQLGLQWRDPAHPHSHGRLAGEKRVPAQYLRASRNQRLALLQGLMDTDGTWNRPRKQAVFTTTDKGLAEAAAELVATLGWKAKIFPQQARGFGVTTTAYHVAFTPSGENPFRLSRKASLVRMEGSRVSGYRIVQGIEPVPSVLTRCIDVDSPDHLYLAGEQLIPVHNCLGPTSLSKIRNRGPSQKYRVQLLLYGLGFRALGLPVKRVVLAAYPRTAATLDGMYVWERVITPEDDDLVTAILERTAIRKLVAAEVAAGRMTLMQVPAVPDDDECYVCLGASTEVVTRNGIRPIAQLAAGTHELLVPTLSADGCRMRTGSFQEAPVRYFGQQPTYRIVLEDRRLRKEIRATAEHGWFVTDRARRQPNGARVVRHQWRKVTAELQPGDLLQPLRRSTASMPDMMDVAVAQGFAFGDGTIGQGQRPATLCIFDASNGKDVMLRFFPAFKQYEGVKHVYGLPRFWKELPPLNESRSFLLSWLAGYFAADGNVTPAGQCSLSSAREENLLFVRDLAAVCGIGYRPVSKRSRIGINAIEATDLFGISLQRRDLPSWFFLKDAHRAYVQAANEQPERESYWKVVSVEPTGLIEPVYCATVPGAEAFALADDLMTGNCPHYRPQSAYDGGPGCPGTIIPKAARR